MNDLEARYWIDSDNLLRQAKEEFAGFRGRRSGARLLRFSLPTMKNIKAAQELLRHASSKITMDTCGQARIQDARRAQLRIVKGLRKPQARNKGARKAQKQASGKRRPQRNTANR